MKAAKLVPYAIIAAVTALAACGPGEGVRDRQERQSIEQLAEADRQVGMPRIANFQERRLAVRTMEARDSTVTTFAYTIGLDGKLNCLGRSIGYGLPYAAQITNPEEYRYSGVTLPLVEPNGLYMPSEAAATWVNLVGPDGRPTPVFVEPEITISPFELRGAIVATPCPSAP